MLNFVAVATTAVNSIPGSDSHFDTPPTAPFANILHDPEYFHEFRSREARRLSRSKAKSASCTPIPQNFSGPPNDHQGLCFQVHSLASSSGTSHKTPPVPLTQVHCNAPSSAATSHKALLTPSKGAEPVPASNPQTITTITLQQTNALGAPPSVVVHTTTRAPNAPLLYTNRSYTDISQVPERTGSPHGTVVFTCSHF